MLNKLSLLFLAGVLSFSQSLFAITIINQTDSAKTIRLEEVYRPTADKHGDLAAPIPFGNSSTKITIAPHAMQKIPLKNAPRVLLFTVISSKKKGKKTKTTEVTTCYEPYDYDDHQECFNDDWGFVIHKPLDGFVLPFTDFLQQMKYENEQKQGYGIKCLHPLLMIKVTSLKEFPEDLKFLL